MAAGSRQGVVRPAADFGFVSPPPVDDAVYTQAGGGFVKLDKKPGAVLWRALKDGGGMMGSAFASPVFARLVGADRVVIQTRTKLAEVDRDSGAALWEKEIPSFRGMNILTLVPHGEGGVLTSTYGGTTRLLPLKKDGSRYAATDAWTLRYEGNMNSPVVVNGHAYLVGKDRQLVCMNVESGKEAWSTEERFGEYWSLAANGDKILALDQRGTLYLLRVSAAGYEPLDKRKIAPAATWTHLAVCGEELVVRDLAGLSVWRWSR